MIVMLTDSTDVGQKEGLLKARSKQMSMAALIPGLAVSVEGDNNNQNVLVASKIRFKGSDLKNAKAIAAGMHDTNQQVQKNQEELQAQHEALQKHQQAIAANKAVVDAATARFGQLDDYYIMDEVTVYVANGKTKVDPNYISQITTLAQNANKVDGYMIEVKGYASAVGSPEVNQKLSQERAQNVCDILLQQGKVPLTRMLAPGAMGESEQVSTTRLWKARQRTAALSCASCRTRPSPECLQPELQGASWMAGSGTTAAVIVKPASRIRRLWHSEQIGIMGGRAVRTCSGPGTRAPWERSLSGVPEKSHFR